MFHKDDLPFAKIARDLNGREHILIGGHLISLVGEQDAVNEAVGLIASALRNSQGLRAVASSSANARPLRETDVAIST